MDEFFAGYGVEGSAAQEAPFLTKATSDGIANNTMCRFYGMVQEQRDPQYFLSSFQTPEGTWHSAHLRDTVQNLKPAGFDEAVDQKLTTCKPYVCVNIPGQSAWVQPESAHTVDICSSGSSSAKRARDEGIETDHQQQLGTNVTSGKNHVKQSRPDSSKEPQDQNQHINATQAQEGSCIVYVYDESIDLRLHDVIEVIGVFSCAPELATLQFDEMSLYESAQLQPPSSQVMRLHAIQVRSTTSFNLCKTMPSLDVQAKAAHLRSLAIDVLAGPLNGDKLAAEYLLLQLMSRVHTRAGSSALGSLSVNLFRPATTAPPASANDSAAPASAADAITQDTPQHQLSALGAGVKDAVASLVAACIALPLTVSMLNSKPLRPHKDSTDALVPTPLQMAAHTLLLLDETQMQAGQLNEIGCANIAALETLAKNQQVEYDFGVYTLPMPADVPVTILSDGPSLLKASVSLEMPLNAGAAGQRSDTASVPEETMQAVRAYVHQVQQMEFSLDKDHTAWLEQEFVNGRQQGNTPTVDDFHRQLTLGRLVSISWGESEMTRERWHQMKSMEHARQNRLKATRPSAQGIHKIVSAGCG